MRSFLLPAALGLASCAVFGPAPPEPELLAWRLVEVEAEGGKELVFERGGPSGGGEGVEVRLSRDRAAVGEVVEAAIRVPGARGRRWIEVHPGRPGVRVLGPRAWIVEGDGAVTARFTCDTAGPGGILVLARE